VALLISVEILRPLTTVSDLPNHPRLSRPYTESGLPELVKQAQETLHKELSILWTMKELFTRFRGDADWAPVGESQTDFDDWLKTSIYDGTVLAPTENASETLVNGTSRATESVLTNGILDTAVEQDDEGPDGQLRHEAATNGNSGALPNGHATTNGTQPMMIDDASDQASEQDSAHPLFLAPPPHPPDLFANLNPDIDPLGPLHAYISRQEEIVRLAQELHTGLLKALRMRKQVFGWCKAEGHVGEMSDGEDWVDLDEWGLEPGQLVKGKEEDDNGDNGEATAGAKRGRRRVGEGR
jgi:hypothetical protein